MRDSLRNMGETWYDLMSMHFPKLVWGEGDCRHRAAMTDEDRHIHPAQV